ncbi:MAG TPA: hemolysin family protein [Geminicoccaceae bacterium]|nr:hemolysin family protein [Geminicoccaceae bacterium]
MIALELGVVVFLIVLNGFFAMAELAVVSSRRPRLNAMADVGHAGARAALRLLDDQAKFLSSVQIGITLIGILAGAFGGATLAGRLAEVLRSQGMGPTTANAVGVAAVVGAITYLSLIVGELVPKQLALANPERIASRVARPMSLLARVAAPAIWLLQTSSRLVLRLIGQHARPQHQVTEEEIRALIVEAETAGVVETAERHMIGRVMRLGDRSVLAVMTPRRDVDWVDITQDEATILHRLRTSAHSRLPAARGQIDEVVGVLHSRDVLHALVAGERLDPPALVRAVPVLHDNADALDALETLRSAPVDMAFVVDEHGTFEGIITAADLLAAIAGQFAEHEEAAEPAAVRRDDGSWLLAGAMPVDEMADLLRIALSHRRDYHTVAGFVLDRLGHFPRVGEAFSWLGWRFEVVDLDRRRIDKVLVQRLRRP